MPRTIHNHCIEVLPILGYCHLNQCALGDEIDSCFTASARRRAGLEHQAAEKVCLSKGSQVPIPSILILVVPFRTFDLLQPTRP